MGRLFAFLSTVVAVGIGLITVFGLVTGALPNVLSLILQIAVITVGLTLIIGVLNLLNVHTRRVARLRRGWPYSIVLVASFLAVIILWLTDADSANLLLLQDVQVSIESALASLLVFALVYGAYRLMRRRVTWGGVLFTLSLLIMLIGALPLPEVRFFASVRDWLLAVPVSAGARGLLLGIALATVVTAMRVLIGQERAYRE